MYLRKLLHDWRKKQSINLLIIIDFCFIYKPRNVPFWLKIMLQLSHMSKFSPNGLRKKSYAQFDKIEQVIGL